MRRELKAGDNMGYLRRSFLDPFRSREAGVNPARPPPLSPGTPRATNHWTREIDRGRASGKEPDGEGSGSQETCRTERFSDGERRGDVFSTSRDAGRPLHLRRPRLVEREVRMTTALLLVLLGALSRLLPHPPNFVAMGAIGLFAGARLPRRWAWVVPLAAMALSDLVIDWGTGRRAITPVRIAVYGSFTL